MRGGKRSGAGRKAGTVSEATARRRAVAEKAAAEGITPLDLSLAVMRALWAQAVDETGKIVNMGKAMQAHMVGKDAAPFVHPKLSNIQASGPDGGPLQIEQIEWVIVDPTASTSAGGTESVSPASETGSL